MRCWRRLFGNNIPVSGQVAAWPRVTFLDVVYTGTRGIGLRQGPRWVQFLVSEVTLYSTVWADRYQAIWEKGIKTFMAQGRSARTISMIK